MRNSILWSDTPVINTNEKQRSEGVTARESIPESVVV